MKVKSGSFFARNLIKKFYVEDHFGIRSNSVPAASATTYTAPRELYTANR